MPKTIETAADQFQEHPDKEVNSAIIKLSDALRKLERNSGGRSILILRQTNYCYRAQDGKPVPNGAFTMDRDLLAQLGGTT